MMITVGDVKMFPKNLKIEIDSPYQEIVTYNDGEFGPANAYQKAEFLEKYQDTSNWLDDTMVRREYESWFGSPEDPTEKSRVIKFQVFSEVIEVDLDGDHENIPASKAHRTPTVEQIDVLKYLLDNEIIPEQVTLTLEPGEYYTRGLAVPPCIIFDAILERTTGEQVPKTALCFLRGNGKLEIDHHGVTYTSHWSPLQGWTVIHLNRLFDILNERFGKITYRK